jgi:hypothetical protein
VNSYLSGKKNSSAKFSNNPGTGEGTYYGDSGEPIFFIDSNLIVAMTSFGWAKNNNCVGNDINNRMAIPDALGFPHEVIDKND